MYLMNVPEILFYGLAAYLNIYMLLVGLAYLRRDK